MWQVISDGLSVLAENWLVLLGTVAVVCLAGSASLYLARPASKESAIPWRSILILILFFAISVVLRLTFLTEILVPPYFDSVEHYRIIQELVTAMESSSLPATIPTLTPTYYHLGFHFLASLLTFSLRANPMDVILVLGQVILAGIPVPIFFLVRQETRSDTAGFFTILLAGFGWYMPGFAVNWGKYPALGGLLALGIVLNLAYSVFQNKTYRNRLVTIGALFSGVLVATVFHTRTLIVILIALTSWLIANKLRTWSTMIQYFSVGILLAGILVFGILVQRDPLLNLSLDPYLSDGLWVTLIILVLCPFALIKFPRGFYFCILFSLCVLAALFIPIALWLPGLENQTLLDRPFVEMVLYLPLALLGGLGLAGLQNSIRNGKKTGALEFPVTKSGDLSRKFPKKDFFSNKYRDYARIFTVILFFGITGILSLKNYNFYPSDCCNFMKYDDTVAVDWLDRNLPADARILVASTGLNVLPSGPSGSLVGTDAGIWIPMLIGRDVSPAPFDSDFHSTSTLEQLCQQQIDYLYVGGTAQSFDATQLLARTDWYAKILSLSNAQLYQVIGCK